MNIKLKIDPILSNKKHKTKLPRNEKKNAN